MSCDKCGILLRAVKFYSQLKSWRSQSGNILDGDAFRDMGFFARRALGKYDKIMGRYSLGTDTNDQKSVVSRGESLQKLSKKKTRKRTRKSKK